MRRKEENVNERKEKLNRRGEEQGGKESATKRCRKTRTENGINVKANGDSYATRSVENDMLQCLHTGVQCVPRKDHRELKAHFHLPLGMFLDSRR